MNFFLVAFLGILLGISLAGPPGPVTAIMVERSMKSVLRGISVGLGAMTADFILMVVILLFGTALDISRFNYYIYAVGAVFFIYLAYGIATSKPQESYSEIRSSGYIAGLSIGLINPLQVGWWLTAGLSVFQMFGITPLIFLFVGIIIWVVFLTVMVYAASARYGDKVRLGVKIFSVASLSFFGILFLYLSLIGILH